MNIKRWLPKIVVLALVAGGVAVLLIKKPWAKSVPPITYSTVAVGKGNIAAQVTANGTLSARGTVQVGAQVSGRVVELHADFNDMVKKGQVIAKLDPQVLNAQIESASASLALAAANVNKANVALADADRQLKRQKTLQEQQLVAGATVESAEVAYDTAKAALLAARASSAQASANLSQAKLNLSYATIYSPVDGVVLSRAVDVGQTVAASLSAPVLFTIAEDLARMQIDTSVSESDVGRLTESMKAQFTVDAFPGKTFEGIVRQVRNAPTTTQGVVTYDAVIDVDNAEKQLRPGMTANVTFVLAQVADAMKVENVLKIPNAALRFKPSRDQMQAMRGDGGGSGSGSGHRGSGGGRRGSGGSGGSGADPGSTGSGKPDVIAGASGTAKMRDFGDKKPVWKLTDGVPKMVLIKPGLTDQPEPVACILGGRECRPAGHLWLLRLEGDLQPGDQLVTELTGVAAAAPGRKVGAF